MSAPEYIPTGRLELAASSHPNHLVARAGFDLSHPYLEQCWMPLIGPSAVAFLRRVPVLWQDGEPATIPVDELARSMGLGAANARRATFARTLDRLIKSRFAEWRVPAQAVDVYLQVPPVPEGRVYKLPEWSAKAHGRLLTSHLNSLAQQGGSDLPPPAPSSAASDVTARLNRLQRAVPKPIPAIGR
jgi:hypothetical protein